MTQRRLLFGLFVVVQLVVLYWPRAVSPPGGLPWDKLVHAAVFGLVAWSGVRAGVPAGWLAGLLFGHAVLSELVQDRLLPHRSGDPGDAVADLVGTLLGLLAAVRTGRRGDGSDAGRTGAPDRVSRADRRGDRR